MIVEALVEGSLEEAVARKLVAYCEHELGTVYGKRGWTYVRDKVGGFDVRARHGLPILVLVDMMDTGLDCPPQVPAVWLPDRCSQLLLRVAVPETESWLLADAGNMARFLGISRALIPGNPESLQDPKQTLVNLARRSRRTRVREAMIPPPRVSSVVGPGYEAEVEGYVANYWNIEAAMARSQSLERCVARLGEL